MGLLGGILMIGAIAAGAPQTPPIFQPGAPGAAAQRITAERAVEMSRTGFTTADVEFMRHMLVHHQQAIEMVALMDARAEDAGVRKLGQRIALSQEAEMTLMRDWLAARGQAAEMTAGGHAGHGAHAGHGEHAAGDVAVMPGMLTPNQMRALGAARGAAFDGLFLSGMIQHHQGALDMVEALLDTADAAEDPTLSDFTGAVVADQSAEISRMRMLLSEL